MVRAAGASRSPFCPDCGTELSREPWAAGLCPHCLVVLALGDTSLEAILLGDPREAPTLEFTEEGFAEGEIHGDRYRIRSLLGRGGMGEVWRAYDLKLRVDVALKALRTELIQEGRALETLRQEVRVAREVISPNVCRVYDLEELDGEELISMEYVDGTTLQEILKERGPLELDEAREIASQFLAGLEAIHEAGLVHRDIKPENLMITRTSRVVVMDFGVAKGLGDIKGGMVAGTPAYMSPEQARGRELDSRGDLFSAGVVLAEMVEPGGMGSFEDRRRLWEGIHQKIPQVSETPWSKVIASAVAPNPEERFASASALARALEEVTLRAAGDEKARPYPGLSAFQQEDARFFFGRELEVEALWKKLRRPHLLAIIGPSGAGKSSFLRAGLLPTLTDGWRAIVATPGNRPFDNLARALATELGDSPGAADLLLRFEEFDVAVEILAEWRQQEKHGLVIVDQFEELFTQNSEEVQQRFAELLGRLPLEADIHVLLSMRGDFLDHCHGHQALQPMLSDLTLLGPPTGASLRRAIVEPSLRCGYRFEEESIVEEMLAEVEGERGALPMVAFAAARLWETRDRDQGLLTRKAYEEIGGVGGAMAQHAEATLERVGNDHIPIVRELFRNLVTAEGTRAARDREELLSVFEGGSGADVREGLAPSRAGASPAPTLAKVEDRKAATQVLATLIDARLLTSYETPAAENEEIAHHRIEIVHESLLANWPRLVRWQMQDAEGAQLREELRNQAQLWEQHVRSIDYLWTGAAYLDYLAWRERYPGGLTTTEEEFARAMTAHAERGRRRRRVAATAVVLLSVLVTAVTGGLWLRSVAEARRAEAAKLLAIAQLQLESDPTEALAFTTASLELADTEEARIFALRALSEAPPALILDGLGTSGRLPVFSGDGRWLATAGHAEEVLVWSQDGGGPFRLSGHKVSPRGSVSARWHEDRFLVTGHWTEGRARIWSIPGGELVREIDFGSNASWWVRAGHLGAEVLPAGSSSDEGIYDLRSWRLPGGEAEDLGHVGPVGGWSVLDPSGPGWIYAKGNRVFYRPLPVGEGVSDRLVGSHDNKVGYPPILTETDRLWTQDASTGELRLWSLSASNPEPLEVIPRPADAWEKTSLIPDPSGKRLLGIEMAGEASTGSSGGVRVWDRQALPGSRGLQLRRRAEWYASEVTFHPGSRWLVASLNQWEEIAFWPLPQSLPSIVEGYRGLKRPLAFSPDSRWLATHWTDRSLRLWPLSDSLETSVRVLYEGDLPGMVAGLFFDAGGERLVGTSSGGDLFVTSLDGGLLQRLEGFSRDHSVFGAGFSPSGTFIAAGTSFGTGIEKALRVWNLETGETRMFDLEQTKIEKAPEPEGRTPESGYEGGIFTVAFADDSTLYTAGNDGSGVLRWDLDTGTWERIVSAKPGQYAALWLSGDRQQLITRLQPWPPVECSPGERPPLMLHDLSTGRATNLTTVVECTNEYLAFDSSLTVYVTGQLDGTLRVGRIEDDESHLLVGHEGQIDWLAMSPDGRWVASTGEDNTLRLWPLPDLDKAPIHTLPRDELIAKLRSLTNIRVVRDRESAEGWKVKLDPFPGWEEVPTW